MHVATRPGRQQPLQIARHQQRLLEARGHVRIETPRLVMRSDRLLEESAVSTRMHQAREQLGIVAVALDRSEQTHQRVRRMSGVGLEVREVLVRDRKPWTQLERATKRVPREVRIQIDAALVQLARLRELLVLARQFVGAQVEPVSLSVVGRIGRERDAAAGQHQRQGLDHTPCDVALETKQISQRRQHGMGREQRSAGRFDELRDGLQLTAGTHQRTHHHAIDAGFDRERFQVRQLAAEARSGGARTHHHRTEPRQGRSDRVRQAECQEVDLGIGAQHAKRQHHESRQRVRERRAETSNGTIRSASP